MEKMEDIFDGIKDPRRGNGEHLLHDIMHRPVQRGDRTDMALFGRAKREFLESFLKLPNGIPSHDTFSRLFRLLNPEGFHTWFVSFMGRFAQACQGVVALDGKTLRRSYDRAEGSSPCI